MVENLTEDDLAAIKDVFNGLDENGNGQLSRRELQQGLRCCGGNPTKQDMVEMMMGDADTDGDGTLSFDEFLDCVAKCAKDPETQECELREAFEMFDEDNSGTLTAEELRKLLTTQGDRYSEEEADDFLNEADRNGDGVINYGEFISMIKSNGIPRGQMQDD